MASPGKGEGPAVLHLHRWDPSSFTNNLSEYREAFLSPTRELLLLLSKQSDALLLPLSRGDSYGITGGVCRYKNEEDVNTSEPSSSRSDSSENIPTTSESVKLISKNGFFSENNLLPTNSCPFISDVKSLAWGLCGDVCKPHMEAAFREFLFVVGERGVTVHAFRQLNESYELSGISSSEDKNGQSGWVEWGPSSSSPCNNDDPGVIAGTSCINEAQKIQSNNGQDFTSSSKRWLRSFLSLAEITACDGSIWTHFPEDSKLPFSATVVSFSVSFDDPLLMGFVTGHSVSYQGGLEEKAIHGTYSCHKVFSSSYFHLVGFVLSNGCKSQKTVVVARVDICGFQWLYSVKLTPPEMSSGAEWIDFQICDKFLISLNDFGFVLLHSATKGEYVACLDVLQTYGLKPELNLPREENLSVNLNGHTGDDSSPIILDHASVLTRQTVASRLQRFCRLIVAPCSSLFAVVDKYGVVYVICTSDDVPDKYSLFDKLLSQYGVLAPWAVGSADISQAQVFTAPRENSSVMGRKSPGELRSFQDDIRFNSFPAFPLQSALNASDSRCLHMRKVFLPITRLDGSDTICFSPLGVTRLISRNGTESERNSTVHTSLYMEPSFYDDIGLNMVNRNNDLQSEANIDDGEAVGCIFQGLLYLVTRSALSVVLPAVSVSPNLHPVNMVECQSLIASQGPAFDLQSSLIPDNSKQLGSPWQVEILDRILLYEGPHEADCLCLNNGWNPKISRLRHLQLVLTHLKFEQLEQALGLLVEVNVAEEGILRMIFAAICMMVNRVGNDAELSAARRILALASLFAIKMLREYAASGCKNEYASQMSRHMDYFTPPLPFRGKEHGKLSESGRIHEMAYYLEIIRNLQCQFDSKHKRPGQELVNSWQGVDVEDQQNLSQVDTQLSIVGVDATSAEKLNDQEPESREARMGFDHEDKLALMPVESADSKDLLLPNMQDDMSIHLPGGVTKMKFLHLENPKDMFARWEIDNLDLKNVVKDALLSGRLPLAVLQLHLHRIKDLIDDHTQSDTFAEVREIGRAIAYELLLKGETALAVTTLQKLGEDIEICLKQLLFGTVSRSLRKQLTEEINKYGFLGSNDLVILDKISLIERVYPCSSFQKTYTFRKKEVLGGLPSTDTRGNYALCILHDPSVEELVIECGDIDGVVLGSWPNIKESSSAFDEDCSHAGYWAAAAVWLSAWDQKTIDRILLDQPSLLGVHVMWESQYEYHLCRNDWVEVMKLLDMMPSSVVSEKSILISLDGLQTASSFGHGLEFPEYSSYVCSPDELEAVYIEVPNIRIFQPSANITSSSWLRALIAKELAKRFIFLKEFWDGTGEIMCLMAQSGFLGGEKVMSVQIESKHHSVDLNCDDEAFNPGSIQAFHKLVVHHCAQHNLPHLLDLYLDHHSLALDNDSMSSLQDVAGDCQWVKWLLFSRMRGREYDASLCNARAIVARNIASNGRSPVFESNELIGTVDDIAEAGWLMAALATLMFAPLPMQNCLSSGSVKRNCSSSQCTLENLRPVLQKFPTIWRVLVSACLGQDTTQSFLGLKGRNALSVYINWRDSLFYSSGHDTSLPQMLPCWFPKDLRRMIQLFVQGPLGWQSMAGLPPEEAYLQRDIELLASGLEYSEISAMSWEAAIQKQIEQELYPSLEESGLALEQHLHRGRALAAFNQLLTYRVQKLKSDGTDRGQSSGSTKSQVNVQTDVQLLLSPLSQSEESFFSSVVPLAITHYQDSVLVASCAFLLELCGLSASILRVDIAALRRIHSFYKSNYIEQQKQLLSSSTPLHTTSFEATVADSLAQALADYYLHQESGSVKGEGAEKKVSCQEPSSPLMLVLQHLEKASIMVGSDGGKTCGSWLFSGDGDGNELRAQQKAASQHWDLVTVFCQMHHLPLSTLYLSYLARDNDWVGFLSEAQVGGYPFDVVVQVAVQEFSDLRLRTHILAVLRGMQSKRKGTLPSSSDSPRGRNENILSGQNIVIPSELFQILAQCEKQKQPGKALLLKAKELRWSLLAMVASCFPDVAALSCLTVWLEITAAREIRSMRENDIASRIAKNVGAAVEALNSLPANDGSPTFHFNRKNPKRRQLMDQDSEEPTSAMFCNCSSLDARIQVEEVKEVGLEEAVRVSDDSDDWSMYLPKLVALLCRQHQFLPLLRAFEMFLPSCSLLSFIRALQAFSQMRLSEASAHLGSFSYRIKEPVVLHSNSGREGLLGTSWISSTAVEAANAMLSTCPSPYEKRCLLQLLSSTDFGDGGSFAAYYRRQYWKIGLAEPALRKHEDLLLGNEVLDDASLLTALENNGYWGEARNWAQQLEASGGQWKSASHHVTERQAQSMVKEWKEFLWDVPEERVALWRHCQNLFNRYSFPALQAGLFFLKHAEAMESELPPKELHQLLLLSLQWLSGMITESNPVCPLHLLREIETRVWLLAVESEAQLKSERGSNLTRSSQDHMSNIVDQTADLIMKMDSHIIVMHDRVNGKGNVKENNTFLHKNSTTWDASTSSSTTTKSKRRTKVFGPSRRSAAEVTDRSTEVEDRLSRHDFHDENLKLDASFSSWEERIGSGELEKAVLSLLEFGQVTAAKQLQHKLSSGHIPLELKIVDAALKFARLSTPLQKRSLSTLEEDLCSLIQLYDIPTQDQFFDPLQVLERLSEILSEGSGRGLCKRIISVVKAANVLGCSFSEAFEKQPTELLQLLSLKAQDSFEEARLLVHTHSMTAINIAKILADSFLKGLLAAHRGGYIDSQKEEGPAPLLWRYSDFLKWAELCPSEQEIGHALMRLVIHGQEIPHACEVELLILAHHFYQLSACLDGVDVLVTLAAARVEAYVNEGDFACLARLITGVGNFHALIFILSILIENGQLDLLLQKYSAAAETNTAIAEGVRGFRMAVLTALKHFNPNDHDAFTMIYNHFDMKHETALLMESRAEQCSQQWFHRRYNDQNEDLLESMRYYIGAAEVYSSIDAGNKTHSSCAQASLVSLQIRMPDIQWLNLSETSARSLLVAQSRFQEALIVAEAYKLNHPSEWTPVLWTQILKPELAEQFIAEFVAVLPLQHSMLIELAKIYRSEIVARGDKPSITVFWTGGSQAESAKYLGRSIRCLIKRTRDLRWRLQTAVTATGFDDVIAACNNALDKVPDNVGPLVLRKGHGGAYLPLM